MIAVVVATFGDDRPGSWWWDQAQEAAASAMFQDVPWQGEVITATGATLADARNAGAAAATYDWVVFLDADDRLAPGYLTAMADVITDHPGQDLLIQPHTQGWDTDGTDYPPPNLIPAKPGGLITANHLVIGTCVNRAQLERVGGFREMNAMEDWDLWLRCWIDGADVVTSDAVYLVQQVTDGRNLNATALLHQQIRGRYTEAAMRARARGTIGRSQG